MCSMIFEQIHMSDIGQKLPGSFLLPLLNIGTTTAVFHMSGRAPWFREA